MRSLHTKLFLVVLLAVCAAKAQPSGFLGAVNGISFKTNIVPSHRLDHKIISDDEVVRRMKVVNMSYSLSYSRVLTRGIEVTAGYQFAKVNFTAGHKWFDGEPMISDTWSNNYFNFYFADHASAMYHGGFLAFDFYRFGSLAPVGKYLGFSISSGVTTVKEDSYFVISDRQMNQSEGFFTTRYDYNIADSLFLEDKMNIRSSHLKVRIGRNYPLTKKLILNLGMSAPIFSTYTINGLKYFGFDLKDDNNFDYEDNDWRFYAMRSIRPYHRLQFEVALRFCL